MENDNTNKIIITDGNEKEYWEEFQKTSSPQIKEALITKYKNLLEDAIDKKLKSNIGKGRFKRLDYEDFLCFGYSGLLEAIDKYQPDKDAEFQTFAIPIIQSAIVDEATRIYYFCYSGIRSFFIEDALKFPSEENKVLILYYQEGLTFKEISAKMNISRSEVHKLFTKTQQDLNKIITITDENKKEYWIEYKKTSSHKIERAFIDRYGYLIKYVIDRNIKFTSKYVTYFNFQNFGFIGFLEAMNEYNPNSDIKFEKYALNKIKERICDFIKFISVIKIKQNYLPKFAIAIVESKRIEEVREILEINFKAAVKPKTIASYIGITLKEYNKIIEIISEINKIKSFSVSLSNIFYNDNLIDENYIINILKSDNKYNPKLIKYLEKLPEKECEILLLYYYDNCNLRDIEKIFGVQSWRKHNKAIRDLKNILNKEKLKCKII